MPVDDVEELHAKIEQIGLHRTKATVVCRNGFQESAVTYAQSMGIGLARILPDGSLIRTQKGVRPNRISRRLAELSLTQGSTEVFFNSSFFGLLSSGEGVNSLSEMVRTLDSLILGAAAGILPNTVFSRLFLARRAFGAEMLTGPQHCLILLGKCLCREMT